jgi:four helix bundle protein
MIEISWNVTGAMVVTDYRENESWRRTRLVVCAALDVAKSLSRHREHKSLSKEIDRLSVSILDAMAKGMQGESRKAFIRTALESVGRLEAALRRLPPCHGMSKRTSVRLQTELKNAQRLLQQNILKPETTKQQS